MDGVKTKTISIQIMLNVYQFLYWDFLFIVSLGPYGLAEEWWLNGRVLWSFLEHKEYFINWQYTIVIFQC
jgi:hypothetical protein